MKKKYLVIAAFICLVLASRCGCGKSNELEKPELSLKGDESGITVKGNDGTEYESYQECCAAQDYAAAHQYLAKLKNSEGKEMEYMEAKEYVFKNEALFLMSQEDETAKKRIIYLLKEEGGNNAHVSMLIDLAIENDDETFVKLLANQYTRGVSEESLKMLMEYLLDKPTEGNKVFVEKLFNRIGAHSILFEMALEKGDMQYIRENASKNLDLSNTKLMNSLARIKDKQISEMILGLLDQKEKEIPSRPSLGITKSDYRGRINVSYDNYISSVKDYNNACLSILNNAITSKNQYLAQRVISKAKTNIVYQDLGDWCQVVEKSEDHSTEEAFKVTLDNTEKLSIKATYQNAVRSGAFR